MSRDFLNFALRNRQLVVLELSSFLPFRAYFGFEYLGEPSPSKIILLVEELVLVEIQKIRVVRPVIQSLSIRLSLKLVDTIIESSDLMFLLHNFRSCLTEQMMFIAFKKRSSQI